MPRIAAHLEYDFSDFIQHLLHLLSFTVEAEPQFIHQFNAKPDFLITRESLNAICEIKFYRSRLANTDLVLQSVRILAYQSNQTGFPALLILPNIVPDSIKMKARELGVIIWDRSNITNFLLAVNRDDLLVRFGQFLSEAQQGIDTSLPYEGVDEDTNQDPLSYFEDLAPGLVTAPESPGEKLFKKLTAIETGRAGWTTFEEKCIEILKHLFREDLSIWDKQKNTDDGLARFDLVCRIGSTDDFWRTLVQSFHSRYILFEFKNYSEPLPSHQIYTTERYLYPKALRGTAIIVARNGVSPNASVAAKGALRENGKLILTLDETELKTMLEKKDRGDSPNDYLSYKLDNHLLSLSR